MKLTPPAIITSNLVQRVDLWFAIQTSVLSSALSICFKIAPNSQGASPLFSVLREKRHELASFKLDPDCIQLVNAESKSQMPQL